MTENSARFSRRRLLFLSLHGYVSSRPELGRPDTGGQVVFVLELAKRFARAGHTVDIVTRRFAGQAEVEAVEERLRIRRIPFGGPAFIPKEAMHEHLSECVAAITQNLRTGAPYDALLSHYWDAGWAGQQVAEACGLVHIHTPHSLGWWKREQMGPTDAALERRFRLAERIERERFIYRRCNYLIATSPDQETILQQEYAVPAAQIAMIPPGIDEERFAPVPAEQGRRLRAWLDYGPHDVLCVGRAATNKGYDLIIESLPSLLRRSPATHLHLAVGTDRPDLDGLIQRLRALAESRGVAEAITWRGHIPDEDLADHYRAASVVALPSRYEPFGMAVVEAMACGTPTVITKHGGLRQLVDNGRHALVADPTQPEGFAAALTMALHDQALRRTLQTEGAAFARRRFAWSGIATETLAMLERAIQGADAGSRLLLA